MNKTKPIRSAIVYDFDGTLAKGNVPEHGLFQDIGVEKDEFWDEVKEITRNCDCDEISVYMKLLLDYADRRNIDITKQKLASYGSGLPLFKGLDTWFERMNGFAKDHNLELEHYVVSSGLGEVIDFSRIARHLKLCFASRYMYDGAGTAIWPGVIINYTTKTQYLFRINKGILNCWDNESINRWIPENDRPLPFKRMIYIGDGDTDIPSMKMIRLQGGVSIAVFDPEKWNDGSSQERIYRLIAEDRVYYVTPADYRNGGQLDVTVKGILNRFSIESEIS